MKDYIKLRCENTDFDDDFPDDLIRRREVYAMLDDIGGAGAEEDYFKGWDACNGRCGNDCKVVCSWAVELA